MARLPRLVLPGLPHHVTQRGNRRERTFFEDGDYALYLDLLADAAARANVAIWSYCLMPIHVHVIATPADEDGLRRTFRYVHRHYAGFINARRRTTGHLWQGRFGSVAMGEAHFATALRDVALDPVRARLVSLGEDMTGTGQEVTTSFGYHPSGQIAALRRLLSILETTRRPSRRSSCTNTSTTLFT